MLCIGIVVIIAVLVLIMCLGSESAKTVCVFLFFIVLIVDSFFFGIISDRQFIDHNAVAETVVKKTPTKKKVKTKV